MQRFPTTFFRNILVCVTLLCSFCRKTTPQQDIDLAARLEAKDPVYQDEDNKLLLNISSQDEAAAQAAYHIKGIQITPSQGQGLLKQEIQYGSNSLIYHPTAAGEYTICLTIAAEKSPTSVKTQCKVNVQVKEATQITATAKHDHIELVITAVDAQETWQLVDPT